MSRRQIAVVALAAGSVLLAGCGGSDTTTAPTSTPTMSAPAWPPTAATATEASPAVPTASADATDAGDVGRAALETWYSYDTTRDSNRNDAALRATRWLTPDFAAKVQADAQIPIKPSGEWADWAAEKATVTAKAVEVPNQGQTNTSDRYYGMYQVTQTVTDSRGTVIDTSISVVAVVLTKTGNGWAATSITAI